LSVGSCFGDGLAVEVTRAGLFRVAAQIATLLRDAITTGTDLVTLAHPAPKLPR